MRFKVSFHLIQDMKETQIIFNNYSFNFDFNFTIKVKTIVRYSPHVMVPLYDLGFRLSHNYNFSYMGSITKFGSTSIIFSDGYMYPHGEIIFWYEDKFKGKFLGFFLFDGLLLFMTKTNLDSKWETFSIVDRGWKNSKTMVSRDNRTHFLNELFFDLLYQETTNSQEPIDIAKSWLVFQDLCSSTGKEINRIDFLEWRKSQ